jgi:hypothetical protein
MSISTAHITQTRIISFINMDRSPLYVGDPRANPPWWSISLGCEEHEMIILLGLLLWLHWQPYVSVILPDSVMFVSVAVTVTVYGVDI